MAGWTGAAEGRDSGSSHSGSGREVGSGSDPVRTFPAAASSFLSVCLFSSWLRKQMYSVNQVKKNRYEPDPEPSLVQTQTSLGVTGMFCDKPTQSRTEGKSFNAFNMFYE